MFVVLLLFFFCFCFLHRLMSSLSSRCLSVFFFFVFLILIHSQTMITTSTVKLTQGKNSNKHTQNTILFHSNVSLVLYEPPNIDVAHWTNCFRVFITIQFVVFMLNWMNFHMNVSNNMDLSYMTQPSSSNRLYQLTVDASFAAQRTLSKRDRRRSLNARLHAIATAYVWRMCVWRVCVWWMIAFDCECACVWWAREQFIHIYNVSAFQRSMRGLRWIQRIVVRICSALDDTMGLLSQIHIFYIVYTYTIITFAWIWAHALMHCPLRTYSYV